MNDLETKISVETDEHFNYSIIENEILDIEGLSANKKIFLIMLRRFAGHGNKPSYPSYKKLMKSCGIKSDDTITKNIKFFEWMKILEKIQRPKPNSKEKDTNYYILSIKNIRIILDNLKEHKISWQQVEKYFDDKYKENKAFVLTTSFVKYFGELVNKKIS